MNDIEKKRQRQAGFDARLKQINKDDLSQKICQQFMTQDEYKRAKWVMWYLNFGTEVITRPDLVQTLNDSKKNIIVPYCTKDLSGEPKLGLWLLEDFSELVPGMWGILEPPKSRWGERGKTIAPELLDVILVPGVAFDQNGGRLGYGAGYYDRLLKNVRSDAIVTGVSFESQLVPKVIMQDHDVFLDKVITEKAMYVGKGRSNN